MDQVVKKNNPRENVPLLITWVLALVTLLVSLFLFSIFRPVTISFIDVGQGDSCLIQAGKNGNVLIDGGDEGNGKSLIAYFNNQNVSKLNAVFVSHFHNDHVTGILELLDLNFPIECLYISKHQSNTEIEDELLSKAKTKNIPVFRLQEKDEITLGKARYLVISQEPYENEDKINNMSMVLHISYGKTSALLTGDLESDAASRLATNPQKNIKANILKVPHHGGISSVSEELISHCDPDYAIISVGENNYGNPSPKMLSCFSKRSIPVYRTDRDGTIVVTLGKNHIKNILLGKIRR